MKKINGKMALASIAISAMFLSGGVNAASLLGRIPDFLDTVQGLTILVALAGALLGIGVMIAGGFQLKKYADDSRSVSPVKGIIYLFGGIIMFAISATSDTMKATIFGDTGAAEEGDFGFDDVNTQGRTYTR